MTLRRRFFPATKTQAVPGKIVELSVRLQPAGKSTAAAPTSTGGGGVALLPDLVPYSTEYDYGGGNGSPLRAASGLWWQNVLRPSFAGWRVVGGYVAIHPPWSDDGGKLTLRAIALGPDAGNVTWTWTLDTPELLQGGWYMAWWDGVSLEVQDGTLKITVLPGWNDYLPETWWATLTCIASSEGVELGRIVLRPGMNLMDDGSLPLTT